MPSADQTNQEKYEKHPLRFPAHPAITPEQISTMVERFYQLIGDDPRLGPIFLMRNNNDWQSHLSKMKLFWRSVLLKTGEYKGQPVPVHMQIEELRSDDFQRWLVLFESVSTECFDPPAVEIVNEFARRIARSLWLSRFGTPASQPPF
jgi:hemoglobin